MPISEALNDSAIDFCIKYACEFDFEIFESRVESYTFLSPSNGWRDAYKMTFEEMYKKTLENVAFGMVENFNSEAMLDDFEYTLMRPYVNESTTEIKHRPYVGMDRMTRLEYLDKLAKETPSNSVDLYTEKYKKGELPIGQMRTLAKSAFDSGNAEKGDYVEIAGYIQALENANKSRSFIWKICHPIRNNTEQKDAATMKKTLIESIDGGKASYDEFAKAARETFEEHKKASDAIAQGMEREREEMARIRKISNAMRESISIDELSIGAEKEMSPRVDTVRDIVREKQSAK